MFLYLRDDLAKSDAPGQPPKKAPTGPQMPAGPAGVSYEYWYPTQHQGQGTPAGPGWEPVEGSPGAFRRPKGTGGGGLSQTPPQVSTQGQGPTAAPKVPTGSMPQAHAMPTHPSVTGAGQQPPTPQPGADPQQQAPALPAKPIGAGVGQQGESLVINDPNQEFEKPSEDYDAKYGHLTPDEHGQAYDEAWNSGDYEAANYHLNTGMKKIEDQSKAPKYPSHSEKELADDLRTAQDPRFNVPNTVQNHIEQNSPGTTKVPPQTQVQPDDDLQTALSAQVPMAGNKKDKPEDDPDADHLGQAHHASHVGTAKGLAESIQSHLEDNDELTPEQRKVAEHLAKVAEYHSNIKSQPSPQQKKQLREIAQLAKQNGVHQKFNNYSEVEGTPEKQSEKGKPANIAGAFHVGRARGMALAASAGSGYGAGNVGSQIGQYTSSEAAAHAHKLLNHGTDGGSGSANQQVAEADRALQQAQRSQKPGFFKR